MYNTTLRWFLSVLCGTVLIGQIGAQSSADAPLSEVPLPVELVIGGRIVPRTVTARIDQNLEVHSLSASPLIEVISWRATPGLEEAIVAAGDDGWLTPRELADVGLLYSYESATLTVRIQMPVDRSEVVAFDVYRPRRAPPFHEIEPATVSVGAPVWFDAVVNRNETNDQFVEAFRLRTSPALSVGPVVIESDPQFEWREGEFDSSLRGTRLVRAWPESGVRVRAGQVFAPSRGVLPSAELIAFSVDNLESSTSRSLVPVLFDRPLIVNAPGRIDVVVNDRVVRSEVVDPGRYEVRSLPVSAGINEVEVIYRRDDGSEERFEAIVPYAGGLIRVGTVSYALSAGVQDQDHQSPVVTGFTRYGFHDAVTAGMNVLFSKEVVELGTEGVFATLWGEPSVALFTTANDAGELGWTGRLGYRFTASARKWFPSVASSLEYRSADYGLATYAGEGMRWQVSSTVSQRIPGDLSLSVGHIYRSYHGDDPSSSLFSAAISRRIWGGVSARVNGFVDVVDSDTWGVTIGVSFQGRSGSVSSSASSDVRDGSFDGSASLSVGQRARLSGTVGVNDYSPGNASVGVVSASLRLNSPFVEVSGTGALSEGEVESYSGRVGAGLYFADGAFAVGRPLRSGFALVRPDDLLPTNQVIVTRGTFGFTRDTSGAFRPALVGPLDEKNPGALVVSVPGLPADYSLQQTEFLLRPGYRRGTLVTIRSSQRLYVRGRLLDREGESVAYVGFRLDPLFTVDIGPDEPPVGGSGFSDELGVFEMYGLVAGEYRAVLQDGSGRSFTFTVPATPGPLYQVGDVWVVDEPR